MTKVTHPPLAELQRDTNEQLRKLFPAKSNNTLEQAMRYVVLSGGKRIRPLLVYATGLSFNAEQDTLHHAACAVELIHCYSLVHDDLPAMDDDDLRRGQPTCHKAFNEATAILVGDALQTMTFAQLSSHNNPISAEQKLQCIQTLSQASGAAGMILGQMLDLENEGKNIAVEDINAMHHLKTGKLIQASVQLGAIIAECNPTQLHHLNHFATDIGLAFQIKDDLLDHEGDSITLGKTAGLDQINQKANSLTQQSVQHAKNQTERLTKRALDHLDQLATPTPLLRDIAHLIISRKY